MSPKTMGRPPSQDPKDQRVTVRMDRETADILERYCAQEDVKPAEGVRRGIHKLEADLKK